LTLPTRRLTEQHIIFFGDIVTVMKLRTRLRARERLTPSGRNVNGGCVRHAASSQESSNESPLWRLRRRC
jgi:hypothetical protein